MKFTISYLKEHFNTIFFFVVCSIIFYTIFSLYDLQTEAVIYSVFLCLSVGVIIFTINFIKEYQKLKKLTELKKNIIVSIDNLPAPDGLNEQKYQELLKELFNEKNRLSSEFEIKRSDMIDYYTLWAHQIKTPIAAMRLLLQSDTSIQNREISDELFKIEQYVNMVLGYLRLDSDTNDLVIQKYNLDSIIKQAIRKYSKQFIMKKISLDYKETGMNIITDEKWLLFVIEQVLSNSLKYTEKGKISIYCENISTLVIEDSGIGIAKEDLPRVFQKGYTGYNGRDDKKSTGIGLYLCKRVTDKLGHVIEIDSDISKGTKVKIDLSSINLKFE